jgi:predicted dehydrogenase
MAAAADSIVFADRMAATMVTSRGFMNRLVALDNYKRTDNPSKISPMVISGTHALDMCMWMLEAKTAVEVYARSVNKALKPICDGIDAPDSPSLRLASDASDNGVRWVTRFN